MDRLVAKRSYLTLKKSQATLKSSTDRHISLRSLKAFIAGEISLDAVQRSSAESWCTSVYSSQSSMVTSPQISFTHLAKAIAAYERAATPGDELSFARNEVLEVSLVTKGWWVARKADGGTGIVPSNFLELLSGEADCIDEKHVSTASPKTVTGSDEPLIHENLSVSRFGEKVKKLMHSAKQICVHCYRLLKCKSNGVELYLGT